MGSRQSRQMCTALRRSWSYLAIPVVVFSTYPSSTPEDLCVLGTHLPLALLLLTV